MDKIFKIKTKPIQVEISTRINSDGDICLTLHQKENTSFLEHFAKCKIVRGGGSVGLNNGVRTRTEEIILKRK